MSLNTYQSFENLLKIKTMM